MLAHFPVFVLKEAPSIIRSDMQHKQLVEVLLTSASFSATLCAGPEPWIPDHPSVHETSARAYMIILFSNLLLLFEEIAITCVIGKPALQSLIPGGGLAGCLVSWALPSGGDPKCEGECPELHPRLSCEALGVRAADGRALAATVTEFRGDWKFFREPLPRT